MKATATCAATTPRDAQTRIPPGLSLVLTVFLFTLLWPLDLPDLPRLAELKDWIRSAVEDEDEDEDACFL